MKHYLARVYIHEFTYTSLHTRGYIHDVPRQELGCSKCFLFPYHLASLCGSARTQQLMRQQACLLYTVPLLSSQTNQSEPEAVADIKSYEWNCLASVWSAAFDGLTIGWK